MRTIIKVDVRLAWTRDGLVHQTDPTPDVMDVGFFLSVTYRDYDSYSQHHTCGTYFVTKDYIFFVLSDVTYPIVEIWRMEREVILPGHHLNRILPFIERFAKQLVPN